MKNYYEGVRVPVWFLFSSGSDACQSVGSEHFFQECTIVRLPSLSQAQNAMIRRPLSSSEETSTSLRNPNRANPFGPEEKGLRLVRVVHGPVSARLVHMACRRGQHPKAN